MKKILIVAPYYKPYNNPRARRWVALSEYWASQGFDIHVLTSLGTNTAADAIASPITIHRTGYNSPKEALQRILKTSGRGQTGSGLPSRSSMVLQWLSDTILERFWWPDNAFLWWPMARKMTESLYKIHQFDAIISVGLPFSAHWAVLSVVEKYKLPWIADMGDPFSLQSHWKINNHFLYKKRNKNAESRVLLACTALAVTNLAAKKIYEETFPRFEHKMAVIGPLAAPLTPNQFILKTKKHKIGYFGNFYKGVRGPKVLFEMATFLLAHPSVELHLAGEVFKDYAVAFQQFLFQYKERVVWHGHIAIDDATELMQNMNILISLGNVTAYQLPSKCADYYASGRPVLHLQQSDADPVLDYFLAHPLFLSVQCDLAPAMQAALAWQFIEKNATSTLSEIELTAFESTQGLAAIAKQYEALWGKIEEA